MSLIPTGGETQAVWIPIHHGEGFAVRWPPCLGGSSPAGPTQRAGSTRWREEGRPSKDPPEEEQTSEQPGEEKDGVGPVG